ncbi:FAD-dependent oxidoreductase [Promicromonospora thailandica]|uniref:Assimilatory nitrate reductase electron transfer subunit n=1 Tax=Promicromonospora thailandica TaxID=765201 RepID=A0A9X2JTJ7_9MICO|nr:FAD-dependent oxidoreductase [Promicromonospora thailandica]MCP2263505.1 assimilatory nitrate reductase electron transfer subunit [Promicromonospora thailandica]BFF19318.1 FAD-dependent oxidoreductase [Promicromonospora thailandica]
MNLRVPVKVVVVGFGMVGSRLVDELLRREPEAFDITVLGSEPYEPYNRVLLSDVVAGRTDVAAITMPLPDGARVTVRRGVTAASVDRASRVVVADDGTRHPYDHLVLATGAAARVPAIPGLRGADGGLPAGVHALRTLDDAREIVAATVNAPRAVVVGGGVLGLEAAVGLAGRGLHVTLVHHTGSLMERQLDPEAAEVVRSGLEGQGVTVLPDRVAGEVLVAGGRAVGIRVRDTAGARPAGAPPHDEVVAARLIVFAVGTVPETGLAASAGLTTDRGIVVGYDLASPDDPRVHAIGDCAQPPTGSRGLVAEGWDQARRLAEHLVSLVEVSLVEPQAPPAAPGVHLRLPDDEARPSMAVRLGALLAGGATTRAQTDRGVDTRGTDVVKVKAGPLSVTTMGVCGPARPDGPAQRAVRLADPRAGRYIEVVVSDGILVGATCVGDPRVAADLTAAYTRRTPVPQDPAFLLLTPVMAAAAPASSPEHMPDDAVVCRCNGVTKGDIAHTCAAGAHTVAEVARETRATTGCGSCTEAVCGLVDWLRAGTQEAVPEPA